MEIKERIDRNFIPRGRVLERAQYFSTKKRSGLYQMIGVKNFMSRTTVGIMRINQELDKISGLDGIVSDKIEEFYVKKIQSGR